MPETQQFTIVFRGTTNDREALLEKAQQFFNTSEASQGFFTCPSDSSNDQVVDLAHVALHTVGTIEKVDSSFPADSVVELKKPAAKRARKTK